MTIHHAKALGIGAAVLFASWSTPVAPAQGVVVPRGTSPLSAVSNAISSMRPGQAAGYVAQPGYAPAVQPAAPATYVQPGYTYNGWTTQQPATAAAPAPPGYVYTQQPQTQAPYPANYYYSAYKGYTQPQATAAQPYAYPQGYQGYQQNYQAVQPTTGNRYVDAARILTQPNYPAPAGYAVPQQTVPMFTLPR